ncbi:hypothetical protein A4G29_05665 [Mycobacterium kansasii]|nr:hypothetical protein A4G29_05665 [Mycobacterium kansasii]
MIRRLLADLDHFFVDRSLGAVQVPKLLREAGFRLTTMREHYGEVTIQSVSDHEWIALTAERGWIGFHKDANIRRNAVERQIVIDTGARLFCVPRADILAQEVAKRYIVCVSSIVRAARLPGPFIYTRAEIHRGAR